MSSSSRMSFLTVVFAVLCAATLLLGTAPAVAVTTGRAPTLRPAPDPAAATSPSGGYPPLNTSLDRDFVGNLTAPSLAPGTTGSLEYTVSDPMAASLSSVQLSFGVYAFNGFPGNATSFIPVAGAPVLTTPTTSGPTANVTVGTLGPGAPFRGLIGVVTSSSTPSGTYAVRVALEFEENGTAYRLASRGWFNASLWDRATQLPNGSATLNLSILGVSGVLPETAVLVSSSTYEWVLAGVLAAAVVLIAAGAYVYFRRGGSSGGTR